MGVRPYIMGLDKIYIDKNEVNKNLMYREYSNRKYIFFK